MDKLTKRRCNTLWVYTWCFDLHVIFLGSSSSSSLSLDVSAFVLDLNTVIPSVSTLSHSHTLTRTHRGRERRRERRRREREEREGGERGGGEREGERERTRERAGGGFLGLENIQLNHFKPLITFTVCAIVEHLKNEGCAQTRLPQVNQTS